MTINKKQLIYIAIDKEDGEPILSSFTEKDLVTKLNEWNGLESNQSKIIEDRKIIYDGEFIGNLERVITYESSLCGEPYKTTFYIWYIEIS